MGIDAKSYGLKQIIGRRIKAIVANEREVTPHIQLFLVFDDDTYYEFYGDIAATGGVDVGGEQKVLKYAARFPGQICRLPERRSVGSSSRRSSRQALGRRKKDTK